jgi:Tol biopolymer transport system component
MMKTYLIYLALITCTLIVSCEKEKDELVPVTGPYFGQTPPGDTAVIFAPGIISLTNRFESDITVSPDGNEVYFTAGDDNSSGIYCTKIVNNVWSDQLIEPIFNGFQQPTFSANGQKIYLFKYNTGATLSDLWVAERTISGWGEPHILPAPFNNTNTRTDGYSEISDSVMYISSNRSGNSAIWCIRRLSDQSFHSERLDLSMDSYEIGNPVIAPDGSYLIFDSNKKDNEGNAGFYVSFNKGNNEWTVPINLEKSKAKINIPDYFQIYPTLSPDGKYLFFNRHFQVAGVWTMDIYWVSTHIIETLRGIALPTK